MNENWAREMFGFTLEWDLFSHLICTCGKMRVSFNINWEPVEVHVTRHVIVDPGGVSDGAVLVHPQRGWLGVVGGDSQGLGLVNKHIWHPELGSLARVEGYVGTSLVFAIQ